MIFFKIVSYFAHCEQERFGNLGILGSGEARYDFAMNFSKYISIATPFPVLMTNFFLENIKKPLEIF